MGRSGLITGVTFILKVILDAWLEKYLKELAVLEYELPRKGVMDMTHTGVPVSLRGRGIAGLLAKAAFDHCVNQDLKMILSCTYLQKYYNDHPLPQYQQRVVNN